MQPGGQQLTRVGATPRNTSIPPDVQKMKKDLPQIANKLSIYDQLTDNQKSGQYTGNTNNSNFDPELLLNLLTTGFAGVGNAMENARQDQYDWDQMQKMNQLTYSPYSNFQPNPYSLYAKYGGSLKKYMQDGGRLVSEVPMGYQPLRTEGKRQYYGMSRSINPAQKGQQGSGTDYENFLINQLQSGISPEELVNKGYMARPNIQKFAPYYKQDIVYTEQQPQQQPVPTPAFKGEPIYEGNKLVGYSRFASRNSVNQGDPGTLNTANQFNEFMFADDMGNPTGDLYTIPASDWSNTFTGGTRHLQTREGLDKYKTNVAKFKKGGIHIKKENEGKFTASAEHAGMGVQEFARHVLANKEDYSSTQVKRANFARNASKWRGKSGGLTPNKAREILHDGTAHGKPISDKQRRFFGAMSKGHTNYRGK